MALPLVAVLALASDGAILERGPTLMRFTCADRPVAVRADRVWRRDEVQRAIPPTWRVEVLDACQSAREFERCIGGGGALAACVLDERGNTIGILRGPVGAERAVEFLAHCVSALEGDADALARVDSAIALGATHSALVSLASLREPCATDERDPELGAFWERRARLEILLGDVAGAESSLGHARAAGIDDHPIWSARAMLTRALVDCAARRASAARMELAIGLAHVERKRSELDALFSIAESMHAAGADDAALDVCAAIESRTDSKALRAAIDTLREHIALGPSRHAH